MCPQKISAKRNSAQKNSSAHCVENPNAFKLWFGRALLERLARAIQAVHPDFDTKKFIALDTDLKSLELKDRVRLIRSHLKEFLGSDYPLVLKILIKAAEDPALDGFDFWPLTDFVQTYGLKHFEISMQALHFLTQKFTAEFAVRPFLAAHPEKTFKLLKKWAGDSSHHVRRCVSEASRPRLPWGEKVAVLIQDPGPGIELLNMLYLDPELYVRKSVANHLNDISKDHPEKALEVLRHWKKSTPTASPESGRHTEWIVRHSLRGLIKKGNPHALELIGVGRKPQVSLSSLKVEKTRMKVGETLEFEFKLSSMSKRPQKLVVDYLIHHRKASGKLSAKVFKLKTFEIPAQAEVLLRKRHSLKEITTRTYHPGDHLLEIQVNGMVMLHKKWTLLS